MVGIRKTKRPPRACVQCTLKKIKCDKLIPCGNCAKKGNSADCKREIVLVRGKLTNGRDEETNCQGKGVKRIKTKGNDSDVTPNTKTTNNLDQISLDFLDNVENIRSCMERLTFGFIKVTKLFKGQTRPETDWFEFENQLKAVMSKITRHNSHSLCGFASYYINFIHNAIVPKLFMAEHEKFWCAIENDENALVYFLESDLQKISPRNYLYWMAMYYATLCNGIYFGCTELYKELDIPPATLETFGPILFHAAYNCLCRAQFMDVPDVRAVQTYCLMSTCFHAYGNVELSQLLLVQCVRIAKKLKLHVIDEEEVTFASEIKKRLWYTLCLIDWLDQIDKDKNQIEELDVPMPELITDEVLTAKDLKSDKFQILHSDFQEYSSAYYQRVMVQMSHIKLSLNSLNPDEIIQGWHKMKALRDETTAFYRHDVIASTDDLLTYDHARFLLFSSLTEELLGLGRKVLAIVGKSAWTELYRDTYIQAAMENLHLALAVVPSYYRRHWIVCQHHVYAALTILLDMIVFPDESVELNRRKLEKVEGIFKIFEELKISHLPARLGLAVLPKLCQLVRFVSVDKQEGNVFEVSSLQGFFKDLQERRDPEKESLPGLGSPQYFRVENHGETGDEFNQDNVERLIEDSSWSEILMSVFEVGK